MKKSGCIILYNIYPSPACDRLGIEVGGDRDRGIFDDNDWDCSGKTLVDPAHIKRTKTRVLVTQHWYVDV